MRHAASVVSGALDEAKARTALRAATRVGGGARVFGWPRVACEGELTVGRRVVFVSTPAPITLLVASGGSLVIGDGALIESGATVRARGRVVIGASARLGVGCIVDDDGPEGAGIVVNDGAWLEDGVVLLAGNTVPAGGVVRRDPAPSGSSGGASLDADGVLSSRVRKVVSRIVAAARAVDAGANLAEVKGWDSLAALRVLVALEKEFSVSLPGDLLSSQPTLECIMPWVRSSGRAGV